MLASPVLHINSSVSQIVKNKPERLCHTTRRSPDDFAACPYKLDLSWFSYRKWMTASLQRNKFQECLSSFLPWTCSCSSSVPSCGYRRLRTVRNEFVTRALICMFLQYHRTLKGATAYACHLIISQFHFALRAHRPMRYKGCASPTKPHQTEGVCYVQTCRLHLLNETCSSISWESMVSQIRPAAYPSCVHLLVFLCYWSIK